MRYEPLNEINTAEENGEYELPRIQTAKGSSAYGGLGY